VVCATLSATALATPGASFAPLLGPPIPAPTPLRGPPDADLTDGPGYAVWQDPGGVLYLQWRSGEAPHSFSGQLVCRGNIEAVGSQSVTVAQAPGSVSFDAGIQGPGGGGELRVRARCSQIGLWLHVDGQRATVDRVRLGRDRVPAPSVPLFLEAVGSGGGPAIGRPVGGG